MNKPKLRFQEFVNGWDKKVLGDLGTIKKGSPLSKADINKSGNPFILYGELYTTYGEVTKKIYNKTNRDLSGLLLSKSGDVLIPASGETAIDISTATCVLQDGVVLGGDLNVYRSDITEGRFISYELNHKKRHSIAKVAQGVSIVHLYAEQLKKLNIMLPSIAEQEKIANFISTVDEKIENQQQQISSLKQIKKGFMQKIFSQKIRFKDDNGEAFPKWKEKKFNDLFELLSKKNKNNYTQYTIGKYGISKLNKSGFKYDINNHKEFYPNCIILGIGIQEVGVSLNTYGCCSPVYSVYSINNEYLYTQFLVYYLKRFLYRNKNLITRTSTRREFEFENSELHNIKIIFPCINEQQKIANFLSTFDEKIEVEKEILQHWQNIKKGLLQQMFV